MDNISRMQLIRQRKRGGFHFMPCLTSAVFVSDAYASFCNAWSERGSLRLLFTQTIHSIVLKGRWMNLYHRSCGLRPHGKEVLYRVQYCQTLSKIIQSHQTFVLFLYNPRNWNDLKQIIYMELPSFFLTISISFLMINRIQ